MFSEKKIIIEVNKVELLRIFIDESGIELQEHIVEKIRNFSIVLKNKKQLPSFLKVINFAGIFIMDFVKYQKDFRPLLKETERSKWKWEKDFSTYVNNYRDTQQGYSLNNKPNLGT